MSFQPLFYRRNKLVVFIYFLYFQYVIFIKSNSHLRDFLAIYLVCTFFPYRTSRVSGRKEFRNNSHHKTMSLLQNESLVIEKNCSDSNANNLKTALHASVIILIMTLIVLGNLMVLIVTFRQRSRPSVRVANMFIANLAVVDLSVAVLLFPFSVVTILLRRWAFGEALCQFNGATNMIAGAASILTMAVISFDRYETVSLRRWGEQACNFNLFRYIWMRSQRDISS